MKKYLCHFSFQSSFLKIKAWCFFFFLCAFRTIPLCATFAFLLLPSSSRATHLMGGNLSYEYLGETYQGSNQYQYRITLITFLDCSSIYWGNGFPETSLEIGIYEGGSSPGATMNFETSLTLPLVDSVAVVPPLPNGCVVPNIPCVYQITYIETVTLPLSFSGYHLYYERCCRNGTILNLANPGGEGMVFSAYIPPTIAVNNSPVFTDMPVPFICVNDTTGILNTATDPDGDLLIFSFENPYEGEYTDGSNPAIGIYPNPINWPFPPVTWQTGGFNKNSPFGPSGYAFINSFTGYSLYKPPATGNYVVAVEIKEYRNGNLIGITRRDMQLLVITCQVNSTPVLSNTGGSGTTSYTIQEGQSLCFPITFTDANTITLTSTGNIFNSSFTNPPATISSPVTGTGSVTTQFCWNTGCNQGQALPYLFNAEATDNGCPPKTTPIVYSITVNNFTGPTTITGINTVCPGISGLTYSTTTVSDATYNWVVTGGTIVSGQGTNNITVNWGNGSSGNVAVTTTSQYGCASGPINLPVTINPPIIVLAGIDKSICIGDTVTLGSSPTAPSGTVLLWSPLTGLNNPNIQNPIASPTSTITYIATATGNSGCVGKDTIVVTVNSLPTATAGGDTTICLGGSVQLNAGGGSTYQWFPTTGLNNPNIQNPVATPTDTTTYSVIVSNLSNCKDTDSVTVFIITSVPADAGTNKTICVNDSVQIGGTVPVPQGTTFSWLPAVSLNNNTLQNPKASPTSTTTYIMTLTTPAGCTGIDSVKVTVNQLPVVNAGTDKLICVGDTAQLNATGGGNYLWSPGAGLSSTTISNPNAFPTNNTQYIVTVTDGNNCKNADSVMVIVSPLPVVDAGTDKEICFGDSVQLNGTGGIFFVWNPSTSLSDDSISNPFAFPVFSTKYYLTSDDFNSCSNIDSVIVNVNSLPTIDAGSNAEVCIGDSVQLSASGGILFSWTPSVSLSDDSISDPFAFPSDTTKYFVSVSDTNGCGNIDSVIISVNPLPLISAAGSDTVICQGDTTQLVASGTGVFQWAPATWLNNNDISNPLAFPIDTTEFIATITDGKNCKNNDSVLVIVLPLPVIDAGTDMNICVGDSTQLNAGVTGVFGWSPPLSLSDDSVFNPFAFPVITTIYYLNTTDSNSCNNIDSVTVHVNNLPVVDAGNNMEVCLNDSVQLSATGGLLFSWTPGVPLSDDSIYNPFAFPTDTTLFFVDVTDSNGCVNIDSVLISINPLPLVTTTGDTTICSGEIVQVSATGGTTCQWAPTDSLSDAGIYNPFADPSDTTIYFATVTDGKGCSNTDSVIINVKPTPLADAGSDGWLCPGDSVQLIAVGGNFFSWSPAATLSDPGVSNPMAGPSDTTKYFVTVTNLYSCSKEDSVSVFVNGVVPTEAGDDVFICINDSVKIGGSPTSPNGSTFFWSPFLFLDDNLIPNPTAFPSDTIMYYLTTTNDTCTGSDSVKVIVHSLPFADAGTDTAICLGDTTQLQATGGTFFIWTPFLTLSDDSVSDPFAFPADTTKYFLTIKDINNCSSIDSVIVAVKPLPIPNAGADKEICIGDSTQLIATGGSIFAWTPPATLSADSIFNPFARPTDTTDFIVNVTDANNCSKADTVQIIVNPLPDADAGTDKEICFGDTAQLNASGGDVFSWNNPSSLSDDSIANPLAFPNDTTIYFVVVTDSNLCSKYDSALVVVNPLPIVDAGLNNEICIGDSVQLYATGGTIFSWIPGATLSDDSIADPVAFPTDTTTFFVYVVDSNSCGSLDSIKIDVNNLPVVTAGADKEICIGDSTQLLATGGIIFAWTPSLTLSADSISDPVAFPADTTEYIVTVSDTNNCFNSDSVQVIVNPLPDPDAGADKSICIGDTVQLLATGGLIFFWNNPSYLSDDSIADPFAFPSDTTEFIVIVTDSNNCSKNDTVNVIVNSLPVVDAGMNKEICTGDSVQLSATGGTFYVWFPAATLSDDSIANPFAYPIDTTWYFVNVLDSNSCGNNDSVLIDVNELPVVTAGADKEICLGDSTQLIASGGIYYNWTPPSALSDDSIFNPVAYPADTTEYIVHVSDSNSCVNSDTVRVMVNSLPDADAGADNEICFGDTAQLSANGGVFFVWNNSATLSDDSIFDPLAFPGDTTVYLVIVTDSNLCSKADSVTVIVNPLPDADAGLNKEICIGDTTILNASGGSFYVWIHDSSLTNDSIPDPFAFPGDTTTYFVNVTDSQGCSKMDSVQIDVNELPLVTAGADTNSCKNQGVVLGGSPTGPDGSAFLWTPSSGLDNNTLANPTATPDTSTQYYVYVTDSNGCKNSDSIMVSVFFISTISDTSLCQGDSIALFVIPGSGTNPFIYLWSPASGLSSTVDSLVKASPGSTIVYTVSVTDGKSCVETRDITVVSISPPLADFDVSLSPNCEGVVAKLKNKTEGATSFNWLFGDGETSSEEDVKHFFSYDRLLEVTLTAFNGLCPDDKTYNESIKSFTDYFDLKMPNVITPNNDGLNDCFEMSTDNSLGDCTDLHIFNRWGELMFASAGNQSTWCGRTFAGEEVPTGTYFYVIDINGHLLKGSVMVIR